MFVILIYQDLLKHTPADHPDYPLLQDALRISQNFLSSINEDIDPRRTAVTTPKGEVRNALYLLSSSMSGSYGGKWPCYIKMALNSTLSSWLYFPDFHSNVFICVVTSMFSSRRNTALLGGGWVMTEQHGTFQPMVPFLLSLCFSSWHVLVRLAINGKLSELWEDVISARHWLHPMHATLDSSLIFIDE